MKSLCIFIDKVTSRALWIFRRRSGTLQTFVVSNNLHIHSIKASFPYLGMYEGAFEMWCFSNHGTVRYV